MKNKNRFFKNMKTKIVSLAAAAAVIPTMLPSVVYAAGDTSSVTAPLDSLKTLVIAIIGAVGVIILAKNVMEFAQAYQQQDSSTMNDGRYINCTFLPWILDFCRIFRQKYDEGSEDKWIYSNLEIRSLHFLRWYLAFGITR